MGSPAAVGWHSTGMGRPAAVCAASSRAASSASLLTRVWGVWRVHGRQVGAEARVGFPMACERPRPAAKDPASLGSGVPHLAGVTKVAAGVPSAHSTASH